MESLVGVLVVIGLVGIIAELLGAITTTYLIRKTTYSVVFISCFFVVAGLLTYSFNVLLGLVMFFGLFRAFNSLRAVSDRMNRKRMLSVTRRSSFHLILYQLIATGIWYLAYSIEISSMQIMQGILLLSVLASLILLLSARRTIEKSSLKPSDNYTPDIELPTLSVCIPARNETDDLAACLQAVVDSDYPKLEILVLDDCSHDKTSEIIKSFAKKGVRFIKGEPPKKGWLAKNQAYDALSKAASSDILVFMGVDVILGKKTLKTIVATMKSRDKTMISVLPFGEQDYTLGGIIQPLRYWWEVALPRRMFNKPPVLSTFWAVDSRLLKKNGGLKAVDSMVVPEAYFARVAAANDNYSFMRVQGKLDIKSTKQLDEQWNTAIRVRYPQLKHRPESVALVFLAEFGLLLLPIFLFIFGFLNDIGSLWLLAGLSSIMLGLVQYLVVGAYRPKATGLYILLLPVSIIFDLIVLLTSMHRYEFSKIIWKERNVCIPVMQTVPNLPKV